MAFKSVMFLSLTTLVLSLLLWDWQEINIPGNLGFIRNNLAWVIVVGLTCIGIFYALSNKRVRLPTKGCWLLLAFLIAITPFFINHTEYFSYGQLLPLALLGSILFYLALFQIDLLIKQKEKILVILIVVTFVEALIGCWQLFHSLMMQLTSDVKQYRLIDIDGTFNQRNVFASFLSTGLIVGFYLLVSGSFLSKKVRFNSFIIGFLIIGSFILLLTQSRVGIYSFIAGIVVLTVAHLAYKGRLLKAVLPAAIGTVLAISFSSLMFEEGAKDFSKTHNRQLIYNTSLEAISQAPVLGHGLGSFEKVYLETLSQRIERGEIDNEQITRPENLSHPHNELLYWGIQGGLVSIIGLLLLVGIILASTWKAGLKKNLIYYSLLIPVVLHLMVELPFYISGVHITLAIFLVFYVVASIGDVQSYRIKVNGIVSKTGQYSVVMVGVGLIGLLLVNSYSLFQVARFETALNRTEAQLQKAIVTVGWDDAYQSLLLKHRANIAVKKGEKQPVIDFLQWLEQQNAITPRLQYFFNIYYSHQILGNLEKADETKNKIEQYYKGVKTADEWLKKD